MLCGDIQERGGGWLGEVMDECHVEQAGKR